MKRNLTEVNNWKDMKLSFGNEIGSPFNSSLAASKINNSF